MSKFFIINLIDKIFITISVFLIIFAWINLYLRDIKTTFVFSLIFTFAIVFILFYFFNKKRSQTNCLKQKTKNIDESYLAFKLLSKQNQLKLINSILLKHYSSEIKSNLIEYNFENKKYIVLIKNNTTISQNDIFSILNELDQDFDTLKIFCEDYNNNIKTNFLRNKNIELINKFELYENYFKESNIFPNTENVNFENLKPNYKTILLNFISPNKSKSYFICGLLMIFSSLILPMKIYYFTFGTIFMILSIICRIRKYNFHKSRLKHTPKF